MRLTMEMTEAVTAICADGIRAENPDMTEEDVINELRRRIQERRKKPPSTYSKPSSSKTDYHQDNTIIL